MTKVGDNESTWVGRSISRVEDGPLVTGRGAFTADLPAERYVKFVRSPLAAGRLRAVTPPPDAEMFTLADLAGVQPIRAMLSKFEYVATDYPVLAKDVVRFVGEPIAVVVAGSEEEAEDVVDLVEVDIEPTDPVLDAPAAIDAPPVHAGTPGNVVTRGLFKTDGFDAAMNGAVRRVGTSVRSHRQNATPLEARAAHAAYEMTTGRVTLTCTTQQPHLTRTIVADLLGMPEADLRVVAPDMGGGFGQKMPLAPEYVVMVWLARKLRTSLAWIEDRRENLMSSFHSRDQHIEAEAGFDADGKLVAISAGIIANAGAYSSYPTSYAVEALMGMAEFTGPYAVDHYACLSRAVTTNTCPVAPYRGVSRPAITFALEMLMDQAADALGLEAVEIRRRNLVATFPHRTPTGLVYDQGTYRDCVDMVVEAIDLPAFRTRQAQAREKGRYLGFGLSTFCERSGYGTPAFAARGMAVAPGWEQVDLSIDPSGFVEARIGASPHGQGLRTTLAQVIADELGCSPSRVRIIHGDTDRTPYGWGSFASRAAVIAGGASLLAARKVREKLVTIAAVLLEATPDEIVLKDDAAHVVGTNRYMPLPELARMAHHQAFRFAAHATPGLAESATYDPVGTFSNACHATIVEVDIETCLVKIERFVIAEDAGRLLNPMIVDGQIHGGVAQGIGNALLEEIVYDESGNIVTITLADFLPPTMHEIPPFEIIHVETHSPETLTKAKGLGEGGTIGAPAAVVGAINDALRPFGARLTMFPATPRRIHAALAAAREARR